MKNIGQTLEATKLGIKKPVNGTPLKSVGIGSMNFYKYM
jgi:hypothetical protein